MERSGHEMGGEFKLNVPLTLTAICYCCVPSLLLTVSLLSVKLRELLDRVNCSNKKTKRGEGKTKQIAILLQTVANFLVIELLLMVPPMI